MIKASKRLAPTGQLLSPKIALTDCHSKKSKVTQDSNAFEAGVGRLLMKITELSYKKVILFFTVIAVLGLLPNKVWSSENCYNLISFPSRTLISGKHITLQQLVDRAMPFVDREVSVLVEKHQVKVESTGTKQAMELLRTWKQNLGGPSQLEAILVALRPMMRSALLPFIHRIRGSHHWQDLLAELQVNIIEKVQESVTRPIADAEPYSGGEEAWMRKTWMVERLQAYFKENGSDFPFSSEPGSYSSRIVSFDLMQTLQWEAITLQDMTDIAYDNKISFEDLLRFFNSESENLAREQNVHRLTGSLESDAKSAEKEIADRQLKSVVHYVLNQISEAEAAAISMAFGLDDLDGSPISQVEIAKQLGVSPQYVSILLSQALRKLAEAPRANQLLDAWLKDPYGYRETTYTGSQNKIRHSVFSDNFFYRLVELSIQDESLLNGMSIALRRQVRQAAWRWQRDDLIDELFEKSVLKDNDIHRLIGWKIYRNRVSKRQFSATEIRELLRRTDIDFAGVVATVGYGDVLSEFIGELEEWMTSFQEFRDTPADDQRDAVKVHQLDAQLQSFLNRHSGTINILLSALRLEKKFFQQAKWKFKKISREESELLYSELLPLFSQDSTFDVNQLNIVYEETSRISKSGERSKF